jgi:hypothetical protein
MYDPNRSQGVYDPETDIPFHELAHAIWSGLKNNSGRDPNREVIGNVLGGDLARAAGRPYPDFEILPRAKPGPYGWPRR